MRNIAIFLLVAVATVAGAELAVILTTASPFGASKQVIWTFFVCFFAVMTCCLSLIWHAIRRSFTRNPYLSLIPSVRQTALFSLVVVLSLLLSTLGVFSFWEVIPMAVSAVLIELFFQAETSAAPTPAAQ